MNAGSPSDRDMAEPAALVEAFIRDYSRWNTAALGRHRLSRHPTAEDRKAHELTCQEYASLLGRYCPPGFQVRQLSFGIPSEHDPGREVIVSVERQGDSCVVRTR